MLFGIDNTIKLRQNLHDVASQLRPALHDAAWEDLCHHGPYVAQLDYFGSDGQHVKRDEPCKLNDIDP